MGINEYSDMVGSTIHDFATSPLV